MAHEYRFDIGREYVDPSRFDHILGTTAHVQVAVLVDPAKVAASYIGATARADPDHLVGPLRILIIALHHADAVTADFTYLALRQLLVIPADDADVVEDEGFPHRPALTTSPVLRTGHRAKALAH